MAAAKKTETAKKTTTAAKKPAAKKAAKAEVATNVILQYGDKDVAFEQIKQSAKDIFVYDFHRDLSELKSLELYVKPEENRVYYVFNGKDVGSFEI